MTNTVHFVADDGAGIVGDYTSVNSPRGLLLLHMMPAMRESWRPFTLHAAARNWRVLTVDLRGHGESSGGPDGHINFDTEHQSSRLDAKVAWKFLKSNGAHKIVLGGASVGANIALQFLVRHPDTPSFSPFRPDLTARVFWLSRRRALSSRQRIFSPPSQKTCVDPAHPQLRWFRRSLRPRQERPRFEYLKARGM